MIAPAAVVFIIATASGPIALAVYIAKTEAAWRRWRKEHFNFETES